VGPGDKPKTSCMRVIVKYVSCKSQIERVKSATEQWQWQYEVNVMHAAFNIFM